MQGDTTNTKPHPKAKKIQQRRASPSRRRAEFQEVIDPATKYPIQFLIKILIVFMMIQNCNQMFSQFIRWSRILFTTRNKWKLYLISKMLYTAENLSITTNIPLLTNYFQFIYFHIFIHHKEILPIALTLSRLLKICFISNGIEEVLFINHRLWPKMSQLSVVPLDL